MMQKLVDAIINKQIEEQALTTEEANIYRYGYILLCEMILNIIIALIIGLIFGELKMISFFLFMYIPLRSFCGGWHADKIWKCTIISNLILLLQIFGIRFMLQNMTLGMLTGLFVVCLLNILCIAPVETEAKKINRNERRIYRRKIYWIILVQTVTFVILALLSTNEFIFSLAYVYVVQNVMLVLELIKKRNKFTVTVQPVTEVTTIAPAEK